MEANQLQHKKERPLVLGPHTAYSIASDSGAWKDIPFLKDNKGMLPPNMIVVGDRRRVLSAAKLTDHILLDKYVADVLDKHDPDRVTGRYGDVLKKVRQIASELSQKGIVNTEPMSHLINLLVDAAGRNTRQFLSTRMDHAEAVVTIKPYLQDGQDLFERLIHVLDEMLPDPEGRVRVAIAVYEHLGKPLPLTILETQMGMSGQDINAWEDLVGSCEAGYVLNGSVVPASSINCIRAGTCGGIIIPDEYGKQLEEPTVEIGDAIIASTSIADGAVVRQRAGFWSAFDEKELQAFRDFWVREGYGFTEDGKWPLIPSSKKVIKALDASCRELGLRTHHGANMSKESLYLEGNEERTKDLRRLYNCLSTEMEHFDLAYLAHELTRAGIPVSNGLVSTVVGTVPGGSFAEPGSQEEKIANEAQKKMLEATMRALWKMTYRD